MDSSTSIIMTDTDHNLFSRVEKASEMFHSIDESRRQSRNYNPPTSTSSNQIQIKGIFASDGSSEYVSINPSNPTTVRELKQALVLKHNPNSNPSSFRLQTSQNTIVQEDWLLSSDIGILNSDNIVHVISNTTSTNPNLNAAVLAEADIRPEEQEFHNVLLELTATKDPLPNLNLVLLSEYHRLSSAIAKEQRTWNLLHALENCTTEDDRMYAVLYWLQNNNVDEVSYDCKHDMRTRSIVSASVRSFHLDPDATFREKSSASLHPDDAEDEALCLQYMYNFIRRGKVSEAQDIAIQMGQAWRACSIAGGTSASVIEEASGVVSKWGNPNRALWKLMAWNVSEDSRKNEYERAIYASLSGNIGHLLEGSLCNSWEDHAWAYFNLWKDVVLDEELLEEEKKVQKKTSVFKSHVEDLERILEKNCKFFINDATGIFNCLATSSNKIVREEAAEFYHVLQATLVTKPSDVVSRVLYPFLVAESSSNKWDISIHDVKEEGDPVKLRLAAHLTLYFKEQHEAEGSMLLKAYIRHLVLHYQYELVPFYCSFLPTEGCIAVFAQVLKSCISTQRDSVFKVAMTFFDDEMLAEMTRLAAVSTMKSSASNSLQAIELLIQVPSDRAQAIFQSNVLVRQFCNGNDDNNLASDIITKILPKDSLAVIESVPQSIAVNESFIMEFLMWKALIASRECYNNWRGFYGVAVSCARTSTYGEERDSHKRLMELVEKSVSALEDVLTFEGGWLRGVGNIVPETLEGSTVTRTSLRQKILPTVLIHLHKVLYDSVTLMLSYRNFIVPNDVLQEMLRQSINVGRIAADERLQVYDALNSENCKQVLQLVRKSTILLLRITTDHKAEALA